MTLKEELEILRGEPIRVFDGDPMDIPCIETSDPEKLCKHPVVSVHMITYNHEPYIRQAIEGVMMQKTDFDFELVIGEDCSQDKTREICFEYQKKYPDKIRVLWWHENVSKFGGNGRRVTAHCRGEFIAFCEGDDFWIDPLKLQKQVDVMREHPNVGLCFTGANDLDENLGCERYWDLRNKVPIGVIPGSLFMFLNIFSRSANDSFQPESYLRTPSVVFRVDALKKSKASNDILSWQLRLGDVPCWLALSTCSDVYSIKDVTSVYRLHRGGANSRLGERLWRDNLLVRFYFARQYFKVAYIDLSPNLKEDWYVTNMKILLKEHLMNPLAWVKVLYNRLNREAASWGIVTQRCIACYASFSQNSNLISVDLSAYKRQRSVCVGREILRRLIPSTLKRRYRRLMGHGEFQDR